MTLQNDMIMTIQNRTAYEEDSDPENAAEREIDEWYDRMEALEKIFECEECEAEATARFFILVFGYEEVEEQVDPPKVYSGRIAGIPCGKHNTQEYDASDEALLLELEKQLTLSNEA